MMTNDDLASMVDHLAARTIGEAEEIQMALEMGEPLDQKRLEEFQSNAESIRGYANRQLGSFRFAPWSMETIEGKPST